MQRMKHMYALMCNSVSVQRMAAQPKAETVSSLLLAAPSFHLLASIYFITVRCC